jgi:DNA-binding MarR family transcriptional regulator
MTAIETLIEMTEVSQFAFYRRLAKGDSLLFLRALYLADQDVGTTQATIRKELGLSQPTACRFFARLKKMKWITAQMSTVDHRALAVRTTKQAKELLANLEAELGAILRQHPAKKRAGPAGN